MEANKTGKMTIKKLSEEFHKEVKHLTNTVISLEKRLEESETKVKDLEEKINDKNEHIVKDKKECYKCGETCMNISELNKHVQSKHPKTFKCNVCKNEFPKRYELENHLREHREADTFKCEQCDKSFVLQWRLKKHAEGHNNENNKCCHYFNNDKICPYEAIGCKFRHQNSKMCSFNEKCKFELCQFKHVIKESNVEKLFGKDFDKLTENEKMESKEVFCDLYCNRGYDCHRCSKEMHEATVCCDIKNVIDEFDDDDIEALPITYYPCSKCDKKFDDFEKLADHFSRNHTPTWLLSCTLNSCSFSTKIVNDLIMHTGVDHLDFVRRKL